MIPIVLWNNYELVRSGHQQPLLDQQLEIRCPKPCNRIPPRNSRVSCRTAALVATFRDVIERRAQLLINLGARGKYITVKWMAKELTVGLINPIGLFPTARRASFTIVRMEPTTGEEAEVPYTRLKLPSI